MDPVGEVPFGQLDEAASEGFHHEGLSLGDFRAGLVVARTFVLGLTVGFFLTLTQVGQVQLIVAEDCQRADDGADLVLALQRLQINFRAALGEGFRRAGDPDDRAAQGQHGGQGEAGHGDQCRQRSDHHGDLAGLGLVIGGEARLLAAGVGVFDQLAQHAGHVGVLALEGGDEAGGRCEVRGEDRTHGVH